MAISYCDDSDLYAHGLPRGAVPNPGRLVGPADPATDRIPLDVHGFSLNDPVSFRAEAGGSLPAPLVAGVTYYVIPLGDNGFGVAAAVDGALVNLTTAGSRVLAIAPLPMAAARAWASRLIDSMLPGHPVPLEAPVPEIVRMTAAELAAGKLRALQGADSAQLTSIVDAAMDRLRSWAKGVPIRGEGGQQPAQLAASAVVPFTDARGWNRWGGL